MNIRYLQSNLSSLSSDNLVKFLYDLIIQDIRDVTNYTEGTTYNKGDKVYLQENGKHQIFQCLVNDSSPYFVDTEWIYLLEVYNRNIDKVYSLDIKEEVHYVGLYSQTEFYTNLQIRPEQSIAAYCGKKRYAVNHDFVIKDSKIIFNEPFYQGDRLILEVRESVGSTALMVFIILYDLEGNPFRVGIRTDGHLQIESYNKTSDSDIKYGELTTGEKTYTLLVDSGSTPYELKAYEKVETYITGTNNELFKVDIINNEIKLTDITGVYAAYSDTKYILGIDNKIYSLSNENEMVIATEVDNIDVDIDNIEFGFKVIDDKYKSKIICIDQGNIIVLPYIDNGGYHNINFVDISTEEVIRLYINDDGDFELNDGLDTEGYSGTRLLKYFYFFDDEWSYKRMYVDNGNLYFEDTSPYIIPNSKGINILNRDGELLKIRVPHTDMPINLVKCINVGNRGTFENPIEGFVINLDGETKLVTVNQAGNNFEVIDTELPFRTNHHYIVSQDDMLYKLEVHSEDDISFTFVDSIDSLTLDDDYDILCLNIGAYIKYYERISRFDIVDNQLIIHPISTFKHRINCDDGNIYVVDVIGDPYEEVLTFRNIHHTEYSELGGGSFYLRAEDGTPYIASINSVGSIEFNVGTVDADIDYEMTSIVQSSQGLYKVSIENENIKLEKLFDNMYETDILSYGNLVKKSLNVQLSNGIWYALATNGLGEVEIRKIDDVNVAGLVIQSDNGYCYGLGIRDGEFTTYESYIANPLVSKQLFVRDTVTGTVHALCMKGDRLCSESLSSNVNATNQLIMQDVYRNRFKIEIRDNDLMVTPL